MNENVHRYLDGEVLRSAVPIPEQEALREIDEATLAVRSWVRGHEVPDLASRVMAALPEGIPGSVGTASSVATAGSADSTETEPAIPQSPGRPLRARTLEALRWVWTPRPIAIRPALAGAFALAIIVAVTRPGQVPPPPIPVAGATSASVASPIYIQFRLDTVDATDVALAGTFTEWKPTYSLHESAPGVWTVTVPLEPGVHDYLFIVDGERWVPDPAATPVDDGFGGMNSRLLLSAPQSEA